MGSPDLDAHDFAVIDSRFPARILRGFRTAEINEYLRRFANVASYTMHPMKPGPDAWFSHGYGMTEAQFEHNRAGYLREFPENEHRVHYLHPDRSYRFALAYSFFLAETYTLLPFYELHDIPFVFVLYPGGAFGLENPASDAMLRRIFASPCFRAVIVTQRITEEYLTAKELCEPDRIEFIYGSFAQIQPDDVLPKQHYPADKSTFDVCFVAHKYSPGGVDKGFDLFVDSARILLAQHDIRFHVVGAWDSTDAVLGAELEPRTTFYGERPPDFLRRLYSRMDLFLSPNRPGRLYPGNFDGFPLGNDAAACGVLRLVADELNMNTHYRDGDEICIIELDPTKIAADVLTFHRDPDRMYRMARAGQRRTQHLVGISEQADRRVVVIERFVRLEPATPPGVGVTDVR